MGMEWRKFGPVFISAGLFATGAYRVAAGESSRQGRGRCGALRGGVGADDCVSRGDERAPAYAEPPTNGTLSVIASITNGFTVTTNYSEDVTFLFAGTSEGRLRVIAGATNTFTTADWQEWKHIQFGRFTEGAYGDAFKQYEVARDGARQGRCTSLTTIRAGTRRWGIRLRTVASSTRRESTSTFPTRR
jgi:hypothetical protein